MKEEMKKQITRDNKPTSIPAKAVAKTGVRYLEKRQIDEDRGQIEEETGKITSTTNHVF